MIQIEQVMKSYGKREAVNNVSLTFPSGKIIGLCGENGSGKSTLLKLIAGILLPDKGSILLDGENVTYRTAIRVAYLTDVDDIFPYFTVKQLFQYYESQFSDFRMDKAILVADFLGVDLASSLKKLSKGSRGRAKIAATLGREVDYYLLDEPLSGLDPMVREDIIQGFLRFVDIETQTIILSTHEIKEVEPILDEVIVMQAGQVIAHQKVDDIRENNREDITQWMKNLFKGEKRDGKAAANC